MDSLDLRVLLLHHCNCHMTQMTMPIPRVLKSRLLHEQVPEMLPCRIKKLTLSLICLVGFFALLWSALIPRELNAAPADELASSAETDEKAEFFQEKVLPLLESRCFECHGADSEHKGDLNLGSRAAMLAGGESGPAIVPEDADGSLLIQAVRYEGFEMPPRSRMPDEEIEILSQWIADGAIWPEGDAPEPAAKPKAAFPLQERIASHWAWKKIERPTVPEVKQVDWPASDIDRFLLAKMEDAGINPAPDAERRVLLRRIYFDLVGLPPTIDQQDQFLNDPAETPAAMEKVVDELLASPHFGERWGRHWLDLVRYAETLGHEFDYPLPYAWRYRDYVIRALNADVPYNEFIREHIAGDLTTDPRRNPELGFNESIIATGFWFLGEDKHAPVDVKGEEASRIDNQIDVFGKTFLGLTIACARCHDHKFDAITTEDYYALSGFLQSSRRRVEWLDSHGETSKLLDQLKAERKATTEALNAGMEQIRVDVREKLLLRAMGEEAAGDDNLVTDDRVARLKEKLLDPKTRELSNPLSLFATLMQKADDQADGAVIQDWSMARSKAAKTNANETLASSNQNANGSLESRTVALIGSRGSLAGDWMTFGAAFEDDNYCDALRQLGDEVPGNAGSGGSGFGGSGSQSGFSGSSSDGQQSGLPISKTRYSVAKWGRAGCVADLCDTVTSASLSPRLRGELHSPEFELTHPEIHILAAGKDARVRLVIDGYVMNEFSELLFSGCRQPINTDGGFRWIKIAGDVKRYLGHRCHLEFLDEGDGWFAVKEIRFIAKPGEPDQTPLEIATTNQNLTVTPLDSRKKLALEWAKNVVLDSAWAQLAMNLKLLPADQQAAFEKASAAWMTLAEKPQPGDPVLVMCDGSGEDEHIFIRGSHNNLGPVARRHLLTALDGGEPVNSARSGRGALAVRVLADSNPFPARVAVNRVWQHLFGRGIVATSENFGVLGEAPTHPELLDLLADDFRKDGWSLKRLIKRLMLARAYRLSSQRSELAEQKDPTNKLLHRFSIRRLEGEVIRDTMLAVSGRLDRTMFGPPVPVYLSSFMEGRGRPGSSGPLDGAGRRSLYQGINRNFLNPFMLAFDTPQPATAISRRSVSTVPAQSLILLNNEFVHQQASVWARHLLSQGMREDADMIRLAYRSVIARAPSETELAALLEFAGSDVTGDSKAKMKLQNEAVLTDLCHVLFNQKEFLFLE